MLLRLDEAERLASELGYVTSRAHAHELLIILPFGIVMKYVNDTAQSTNSIGFVGCSWHTHNDFQEQLDDGPDVSLDELEVLTALHSGELVIVTLMRSDRKWERWIQHRRAPLDLKHVAQNTAVLVQHMGHRTSNWP